VSLRDPLAFAERARSWKALVTFNGTVFDLPILRRVLPDWTPPPAHIDLKHVYQRLREKGGLKELEPRCGLFRPPHLARLTGLDASGCICCLREFAPGIIRIRITTTSVSSIWAIARARSAGRRVCSRRSMTGAGPRTTAILCMSACSRWWPAAITATTRALVYLLYSWVYWRCSPGGARRTSTPARGQR